MSESFFVTGFSCLEGIDYPEGHPTIKWVDSPLFDYSLDPCLLFWALGNSGSNLSVQHVKCCTERNFNLLGVMSNTAQCLSRKEDYVKTLYRDPLNEGLFLLIEAQSPSTIES